MEKELKPIFSAMLNTSIRPAIQRFVAIKAMNHLSKVKSIVNSRNLTAYDITASLLNHLESVRQEKEDNVFLFLKEYDLTGDDPFFYDKLGTIYDKAVDTIYDYASKRDYRSILEEAHKQIQ